jgi:hypothetical protein
MPKLRDDYILVEVRAVGLNPADWKHIDFMSDPGCWCGMDYAGIIVEVGSAVTKPFKKGGKQGCRQLSKVYIETNTYYLQIEFVAPATVVTFTTMKTEHSPNMPQRKETSKSKFPTICLSKKQPRSLAA